MLLSLRFSTSLKIIEVEESGDYKGYVSSVLPYGAWVDYCPMSGYLDYKFQTTYRIIIFT